MKDTRETYTFSRALNLMRYGGKKMQSLRWGGKGWICIENGILVNYNYNVLSGGHKRNFEFGVSNQIDVLDIMGSWVEVK